LEVADGIKRESDKALRRIDTKGVGSLPAGKKNRYSKRELRDEDTRGPSAANEEKCHRKERKMIYRG